MDRISFKANIIINKPLLKQAYQSDKFFAKEANIKSLEKVLARVSELKNLPENSTVTITPRLDNNILNLICKVTDESSTVTTTIKERGARNIVSDKNFAERFIQSISNSIRNVDKTRKGIGFVRECINSCDTIKDVGFLNVLPDYILKNFENGINPISRINSILKRIQNEYPNMENQILIKNIKNAQMKRIKTCFLLRNKEVDRQIPINTLMKDPIDNLFI